MKKETMKIALASAKFINGNIAYNMAQLERYMHRAKQQGAELVCFAEAFLQGFDAYCWQYETDVALAVSVTDETFRRILALTETIGIDLLFGFLERAGEVLYSSCALVSAGKIVHCYRRISKGWKEYTKTDAHYQEGTSVEKFRYRDRDCLIALCGDLWDAPQRFSLGQEILFWPVYLNYSLEEWEQTALAEYTAQAARVGGTVLMVNAITETPDEPAFGGAYCFQNAAVPAQLPVGKEGLLVVEL